MRKDEHEGAATPSFCMMRPSEVLGQAVIDRATRTADGGLTGFQRQPVAEHVNAIASALRAAGGCPFANPIILGLLRDGLPPDAAGERRRGYVIDGQQRLLACLRAGYDEPVPVLSWTFQTGQEMREAFVATNNVRPLPRALIAEILSRMDGLPPKLTDGTLASLLVEALNYHEASPLRGLVNQQTNPKGVVRDTALARGIRNSLRNGMLRQYADSREVVMTAGLAGLMAFMGAVRAVFRNDWNGHTPGTSRLLHSTGVEAMLHVMDVIADGMPDLAEREGEEGFTGPLLLLRPHCRWTGGTWEFTCGTRLAFDGVQSVPAHVAKLSHHLAGLLDGARVLAGSRA